MEGPKTKTYGNTGQEATNPFLRDISKVDGFPPIDPDLLTTTAEDINSYIVEPNDDLLADTLPETVHQRHNVQPNMKIADKLVAGNQELSRARIDGINNEAIPYSPAKGGYDVKFKDGKMITQDGVQPKTPLKKLWDKIFGR